MKRLIYLVTVALVAMLILVPVALAQEGTELPKSGGQEQTVEIQQEVQMEGTAPLPASGGPAIGSGAVLLPALALLVGGGILGYAVLRRR